MINSRAKKEKQAVLTPTEAILESISDGVFDLEWRITSFKKRLTEMDDSSGAE